MNINLITYQTLLRTNLLTALGHGTAGKSVWRTHGKCTAAQLRMPFHPKSNCRRPSFTWRAIAQRQ